MIVADASWVIALRDPADLHHREALAVDASTAGDEVLLHPLTLAECLVAPAWLGVLEAAAAALRAAYDVVLVGENDPVRWAGLRAATGLRLPDAVVLDTAIRHGASAIASFDDRLRTAAVARGIGARPAHLS